MVKCKLVFTLCPRTYRDDFHKTTLVLSRLAGSAASYTRHISDDDDHPLRHNFTKFKEFLDNVYLDTNYLDRCADRLGRLHQTKSVLGYSVEFKTLVEPLGYGNRAKCDWFLRGLNRKLQKAIRTQGRAEQFDDLVTQAIRV